MINHANLPKDLKAIINKEQIDFIIKAKKNAPLKKSLSYFFFSFVWLLIISIGIYPILKTYFKGKSINLDILLKELRTLNFTDDSVLIGLIFMSIGISVFLYGVFIFLQKGGYFIATKSGLIKYRNGKITSTNWEQFSGNTTIRNRNFYGDIALELNTGKYVSRANNSSNSKRYVPDVIHIVGVENPIKILNACKLLMQKNTLQNEIKF